MKKEKNTMKNVLMSDVKNPVFKMVRPRKTKNSFKNRKTLYSQKKVEKDGQYGTNGSKRRLILV